MPSPAKRGKNKGQVQTKSSGGKTVTHFTKETAGSPRCSVCGQTLAGLPKQGVANVSKLSRTQRRVGRTHSGNLCSGCLRNLLKSAARRL